MSDPGAQRRDLGVRRRGLHGLVGGGLRRGRRGLGLLRDGLGLDGPAVFCGCSPPAVHQISKIGKYNFAK